MKISLKIIQREINNFGIFKNSTKNFFLLFESDNIIKFCRNRETILLNDNKYFVISHKFRKSR